MAFVVVVVVVARLHNINEKMFVVFLIKKNHSKIQTRLSEFSIDFLGHILTFIIVVVCRQWKCLNFPVIEHFFCRDLWCQFFCHISKLFGYFSYWTFLQVPNFLNLSLETHNVALTIKAWLLIQLPINVKLRKCYERI